MDKPDRGMSRKRVVTLRVGEIAAAMGVAVVVGLSAGVAAVTLDAKLLSPPPIELGSVKGARVLLGSLTAGLITVSVFGLWMRTVVVGLMAANFSPRTLMVFLDDRFQRNLLAFMSAGVVAVMVILLKMPVNDQMAAPLISTGLAVVIALSSLAGVLLAIQHATRSLALPELVSRLADDALKVLERHPEAHLELNEVPPPATEPHAIMAPGIGWITSIDVERMRTALPAGGVVHLRCRVGEFVSPRRTVALVSLHETDGTANFDAVAKAVTLARTRSPNMDLAFAVSQLVDVGTFALQARADTSTAHEVMVHLEVVLSEIIERGLPRLHDEDAEGRRVYDEAGWDAVDLVQMCVERQRESAIHDPETARHLMQMLHRIHQVALEHNAFDVVTEVECQVKMVLGESSEMLSRDRRRLEQEAGKIVNGVAS